MRIALFGGTFDPIHNGHIRALASISEQLTNTHLQLLPSYIPPHKTNTHTDDSHRLAMLELVCQHYPWLSLNLFEFSREAPSYTIETLKQLRHTQQLVMPIFIIGMDSLLTLDKWKDWQQLTDYCHLVVLQRPGYSLSQLPAPIAQWLKSRLCPQPTALSAADNGKVWLSDSSLCDISSTAIRQRLKQKLSCQHLLPQPVLRYIMQHSLYQT